LSRAILATATLVFASLGAKASALNSHEPCEKIAEHVAKWTKDNNIVPIEYNFPYNFLYPSVPPAPIKPSLAYACLKSVPLHTDTALKQLQYLGPFFEWHSTIDYLKNPPSGYLSDPVDILGGLEIIASNLRGNGTKRYKNEFDFLTDLHDLTSVRVRDIHFQYTTLLLDLFTFRMGVEFVSISKDGLSVPEIFLHDDVRHLDYGYTPSPVSTINGVPALDFLNTASTQSSGAHDPDARFNSLFQTIAKAGSLSHTKPHVFVKNLQDTTKVKLQNSTILHYENIAFVRAKFTGIRSGQDLHNSFGDDNGTALETFPRDLYEMANKNFTPTHIGYPEPIVEAESGILRGFLPDELTDVAVLSINSFVANPNPFGDPFTFDNGEQSFRNATINLIQSAKSSNRSKLILDLQSNHGGLTQLFTNLYFALFPEETTIPLLDQLRAHPQLLYLLQQENKNPSSPNQLLKLPWESLTTQTSIQPNGKPWLVSNLSTFYGPIPGAYPMTHPSQINPSAIPVTKPAWSTAPFAAEDIIILTDGECGSSCALFVSMLTHRHGIRTVTLGGRPQEGKMQAVGMTKGGPVFPVRIRLEGAIVRANRSESVNLVPLGNPPLRTSVMPPGLGHRGSGIVINLGNLIPWDGGSPEEEEDLVPLQFRYEAADCRLFWTWEMMRDMREVWRRVADVGWGGGRCVAGSLSER
ncbi:hypothetical protein QBC38DRAFT_514654, partial [Podospora fimiseda]